MSVHASKQSPLLGGSGAPIAAGAGGLLTQVGCCEGQPSVTALASSVQPDGKGYIFSGAADGSIACLSASLTGQVLPGPRQAAAVTRLLVTGDWLVAGLANGAITAANHKDGSTGVPRCHQCMRG